MSPQFPLSRRVFLGGVSALAATAVTPPMAAAASPASGGGEVRLHWLDGRPAAPVGCAFGVPWPRGTLSRNVPLALHTGDGGEVPLQSWPLAYWPDGSVKWTGHAVTSAATADTFALAP
ncbi:hypothetical protein ABT262_37430, partial [Amycolatopsis mediterranei]